jgi:hypothetical protein
VQASIITGQGVNALNGGYDIQIATGQAVIGHALEQALQLCFEMDEKFWPEASKTVSGVINGTPFQESYTPGKDIRGDHRVSVTYGFASGMNPNQALVFLLQLRGDQLVSRDFVQRQLPMDIDVTALQAQIDNEEGIIALREKGVPMADAILQTFEAPPAPPSPAAGGPGAPGGEGLPGALQGQNPTTGAPMGVAPGQAGMGAGGRPDLQTLLAGLTSSGQPNLSASVKRSVPA